VNDWKIFRRESEPHDDILGLPPPPRWRRTEQPAERRGATFRPTEQQVEMVNAALYLRRPLLVMGFPGSGKSSLAYAVALQLKLGQVLHWTINSRTTVTNGLYHYDALSRLRDLKHRDEGDGIKKENKEDIGRYIRLGPLGTAIACSTAERPRVLLIDEIDKSDIDLANDLLHHLEEGWFEIPELLRIADETKEVSVLPSDSTRKEDKVKINGGVVRAQGFPFVVLTSNGERELPPAFLRRCLQLEMEKHDPKMLRSIVEAHFGELSEAGIDALIEGVYERRKDGETIATDQLMNAVFMVTQKNPIEPEVRERILRDLLRNLEGE
jgi:MoxR-like ATPase